MLPGESTSAEQLRKELAYYKKLAQDVGSRRLREGEQLSALIAQLKQTEKELAEIKEQLEKRVIERTSELVQANRQLEREIAERRRIEADLRQSEEKFRGLVETTLDWIWETDTEDRYTYASPRVGQLLGYEPDEVIGRKPYDFMPPEEARRVQAEFARFANERQSFFGLENVNVHKNGHLVVLETNGMPHFNAQGHLTGYRGIDRDITERKHTENERLEFERRLLQSQKLESLGVLAGGIAHDFNNLLTTILGNASLVSVSLDPADSARRSVDDIVEASKRAAELCRQMLAYAGKGQFKIEQIDLNSLAQGIVRLLEASISKKATLHLALAANLPALLGDATQIRQILLNLVINASEAIGEGGGSITVSTGESDLSLPELRATLWGESLPTGHYVWMEVADTGQGMDAATQARIFEPFFTTKFTGRGLGLSALMGIIRAHHGTISLHSEPGKGTTFRVIFPAVSVPTLSATEPRITPEPWRGSGAILLVEDEETIRKLGGRLLERLGFEAVTAIDGLDAQAVLSRHKGRIRAILLDITMPRLGGLEALPGLRQIDPNPPIFLTSGYAGTEFAPRFGELGLAGFLQKPYDLDELRQKLREACDRPWPSEPNARGG